MNNVQDAATSADRIGLWCLVALKITVFSNSAPIQTSNFSNVLELHEFLNEGRHPPLNCLKLKLGHGNDFN